MKVFPIITLVVTGLIFASTATAAEYVVNQKKNKFQPGTLTVKAGEKITFNNSDPHRHHVGNGDSQMKFNKMMAPGKSYSQLFDEKGRFKVRCALHPKMRMVVTVE